MSDEEILNHAAELVRAGNYAGARDLLIGYLKDNPRDDDGWVLLSYAVPQNSEKLQCLQRALKINPENAQARKRFDQLSADAVVPPFTARRPHAVERGPFPDDIPPPDPLITEESAVSALSPDDDDNQLAPKATPTGTSPGCRRALLVLGGIFGCAVIAGAIGLGYSLLQETTSSVDATEAAERAEVAAAVATSGGNVALPPSWTPSITPTVTVTRTPRPTATITPTPTLLGPRPDDLAEMQNIQVEVSDLRGLNAQGEVAAYMVTKPKVKPILETMFLSSGGTQEEVEDQKLALVALGMIKPTYDLYTNILNGIADGIGGFYDPASKQMFVIGVVFGGVEHYIYSHEYNHALIDQHFNLGGLGVYPACLRNADECRAISALVEGDASLLMDQWWEQYASPQDYEDIFNYRPPTFTIPEQFPPPYAGVDAQFPYVQGRDFVQFLYGSGNWAEVNNAYQNLPESTEQILHPSKYLEGEGPISVTPVDLLSILGEGWTKVSEDALGEWGTYLLLAYGADMAGQISDSTAQAAAAGWGGDLYLVYHNETLDLTTLSAHWIWDTAGEASQFRQAMLDYMDGRFRGAKLSRTDGDCWEVNDQASCVFSSGSQTLWLLAPNQTILNSALNFYPQFP
jgi:hypothetical protein